MRVTYNRQKAIYTCLLHSDKWLSGKQLAKKFNVSSRTIRSDIKFLNDILQRHHLKIYSSKQKGYFIPKEQKSIGFTIIKNGFNRENYFIKVPSAPSERFAFIAYKLAFTTDFITMEELADMLYVSKTTIYLDIKKLIDFLTRFSNLKLEISPIKGLILIGDERSKRSLISSVLKREKLKDSLMLSRSFYYALSDKKGNLYKEKLYLYEIIINTLHKFGYVLTDADVALLVKDILISIKRIQMGFVIEEDIKEDIDLTIVESFKNEIENRFNIKLEKKELKYFQQSFNSKRLLNVSNTSYILKEEGEKIVEEFIKEVKAKFNIDFSNNEDFKANLVLHINPMIERVKANHFEHSPLKDEIKANYPFAFEISTLMIPIISEKLDVVINESELSYIALHVAVALEETCGKTRIAIICGSGLGTAQLIRSKIKSYYNERVDIVGHFPLYKLESILKGEFGKIDLIITTIPLVTQESIPVIQVKPLISDEDLSKIKSYIDNPLVYMKNSDVEKITDDFFKKELFKFFKNENDYFGAIFELTKMLKIEGFINDVQAFYNSVIERENLYSTILDNMIAIPHSMRTLSKTTVVAVGIFENPIIHCGKKIKMILLFAINAKEDEKLKILYGLLEEILDSPMKTKQLPETINFEDFIKTLKIEEE